MEKLTGKHLEDFILDDSFRQFVCGENLESVKKWEDWRKDNPDAQNEFELAISVMKLLLKTRKDIHSLNTEEALQDLLAKIRLEKEEEQNGRTDYRLPWLRIAGILVLLLSISTLVFFFVKNKSENGDMAVYNEIIVPLGEKSQVILADGTHIWINSSSRLKYPVNFNKKARTIFLEGEAFFDVKSRSKQPFIVNTPDLKVKVLGTSFNVKNYPNDKSAVTTVVNGIVSVEKQKVKSEAVYLKQNENYVLYKTVSPEAKSVAGNNEKPEGDEIPSKIPPIINKQVNVEAITSWKDQMLVFSDETLEDVALKMERWYNVKIHILNEGLKKERYRGKFVNNEIINQVLEAIKYTTPIEYKIRNNEIFIDKPK